MTIPRFPMFLGERRPVRSVRTDRFGWELNTSNTGLVGAGVDRTTLPVYTGSTTPAAGTVIVGRKITSQLELSEGNILIDRCWIAPSGGSGAVLNTTDQDGDLSVTPTRVTISNCEIEASHLADSVSQGMSGFWGIADLYNNYIHDLGGGAAIYNAGLSLSCVVEGNLVKNMVGFGDPETTGNHVDGFTIRDFEPAPGRTCVVKNNYFAADTITNDTGAFFIQAHDTNIINIFVSGNYFYGGGYNVGIEQDVPGTYDLLYFTNNRFTSTGIGLRYSTEQDITVWTDNYVYDVTQPGGRGTVVTEPP